MSDAMRAILREVDDTMPGLAARLYGEVERHLGERVIDAGAGVGLYCGMLLDHGKQVVALESDSTLLPALRSRLEPRGGAVYACDLAAPEGLPDFAPADSAICINVAEHVENDARALRNLGQRVKQQGRLIILVPAHPWLYNRLDAAVAHWRRYTRQRLLDTLTESGWRVDDVRYFNSISIPAWFITGTVLRRDVPGRSLTRLAGAAMPVMNWLDKRLARGRVGISLVAVASNVAAGS
jgi:SAM-dependent methyltransferase